MSSWKSFEQLFKRMVVAMRFAIALMSFYPFTYDLTESVNTYPYSDHCYLDWFSKSHVYIMIFPLRIGCKPHMCVIPCPVNTIYEICHNSRILVVLIQNIDVGRISSYLNAKRKLSEFVFFIVVFIVRPCLLVTF